MQQVVNKTSHLLNLDVQKQQNENFGFKFVHSLKVRFCSRESVENQNIFISKTETRERRIEKREALSCLKEKRIA